MAAETQRYREGEMTAKGNESVARKYTGLVSDGGRGWWLLRVAENPSLDKAGANAR